MVDIQSDEFFATFSTVPGVLRAAAEAQDALAPRPIRGSFDVRVSSAYNSRFRMAISDQAQTSVVGRFAFIDLGSGTGGSIDYCVRRFGRAPGRGFELDPRKVAEARRAGFDVVEADVRLVRVPDRSVEFVSAMDFLEHLPDVATAASVLERFARVARDFLFIRHPSFEDAEYLANLGLRFSWSDWRGHPNMMEIEDFVTLFRHFGWTEYAIVPRNLITDSMDTRVVPLSAPTDTVVYDPSVLEPKPRVRFERPVFAQYDIFVRLSEGLNDADWESFLWTEIDRASSA